MPIKNTIFFLPPKWVKSNPWREEKERSVNNGQLTKATKGGTLKLHSTSKYMCAHKPLFKSKINFLENFFDNLGNKEAKLN